MPVRVVESKDNARLKELRKALAAAGRSAQGHAGIEGRHLLEEALRAGLRVATIFVAQGAEKLLDNLPVSPETEILRLPAKVLASTLATETAQLIAALIEPPEWTWEHLFGLRRNATPLVLVLAGLQDPGNLGTILRSAEAFGATGVVCLPGTVSAWNPKAVRASAGSVFRVPLIAAEVEECIPRLHKAEATIFATLPGRAPQAQSINLARPVAFLIGNEVNGVPGSLIARADAMITIPCPGPVESLNAAVAASVLLYEAARQRATGSGGRADHRGARR